MSLYEIAPHPISEADTSTEYAAHTPPETLVGDSPELPESKVCSSSVPWPGSTFIIRSISSGHVITLLDGQVTLASPGGRGSIHWKCVESKGWLGFRNAVSGQFLGHDKDGRLRCSVKEHKSWENFCVRLRPEGGYVLLMTHFERLWQVGIKLEKGGRERLAKVPAGSGGEDGSFWEFVKV